MLFWKRKKPRRVEHLLGEGQVRWYERLKDRRTLQQLAILAGFFVAALLIVQGPEAPQPIHKGAKQTHPRLARVDFSYVDEKVTADLRDLAAHRVPGVFGPDLQGADSLKAGLLDLVDKAAAAKTFEELPAALRDAWPLDADGFAAIRKSLGPEPEKLAAARDAVAKAMASLAQPIQLPILGNADYEAEVLRSKQVRDAAATLPAGLPPEILQPPQDSEEVITLRLAGGDQRLSRSDLYRHPDAVQARIVRLIGETLEPLFGEKAVAELAGAIARRIGPTLKLEREVTENRRVEAAAAVQPVVIQRKAGSTLVPAGTEVSEADLRLLALEQAAYRHELGWFGRFGEFLGGTALIAAAVGLLATYIWRFHPQVARSSARALILVLVCLAVLGASKAVARADWPVELDAVFLTTAGIILTIAYCQVFAIGITWTLILLIALATRSDLDWVMTALAGTTTAILVLGEINKRSKLIQIGGIAGLAFLVAVAGLYLWRLSDAEQTPKEFAKACFLYFCSGLAAGFLVLGLLPFVERLFGIVTNISLLELCDVNQPALRRLAMEAPGTYTHSLFIGSLAQAAAEAIGAKSLLARVGAYFHDIGKVNKPHYFAENALGGHEAHEGLTPAMSRLIILSHVKDGLEMADRMGLPRYIKEFIAEHHGTTRMEYFYREAERRHDEAGGEVPSEVDYRYPGPKPRSRETAIVMLADTVEGAARALKEPTAARIQATVHERVVKRLMDGQLDESGLTLSDLHKIEETLTKALLSVYHTRVPYPADRPVPEAAEAGTREEPAGPQGDRRA